MKLYMELYIDLSPVRAIKTGFTRRVRQLDTFC